jgi:hypothetical protein
MYLCMTHEVEDNLRRSRWVEEEASKKVEELLMRSLYGTE